MFLFFYVSLQFENSCDESDFLVEELSKSHKVYDSLPTHPRSCPHFLLSFRIVFIILTCVLATQFWSSYDWQRLGRHLLGAG
jgi:hypothetical protein